MARRWLTATYSLLAYSLLIAGCQSNSPSHSQQEQRAPVVDLATQTPLLSIFVETIQSAELTKLLEGQGPFTIFAPVNAAFNRLPANSLQTLLKPENRSYLQQLLSYHIVLEELNPEQLKSGKLSALNSKELTVEVDEGKIHINNAMVIDEPLIGSNGIIYLIDRVLVP